MLLLEQARGSVIDEHKGVGMVLHDGGGPLGVDVALDEVSNGLGLTVFFSPCPECFQSL